MRGETILSKEQPLVIAAERVGYKEERKEISPDSERRLQREESKLYEKGGRATGDLLQGREGN